MKKEQFIEKQKDLEQQLTDLRSAYIHDNMPYAIGTILLLEGNYQKTVKGVVVGFRILGEANESEIYPNIYKLDSKGRRTEKMLYIHYDRTKITIIGFNMNVAIGKEAFKETVPSAIECIVPAIDNLIQTKTTIDKFRTHASKKQLPQSSDKDNHC